MDEREYSVKILNLFRNKKIITEEVETNINIDEVKEEEKRLRNFIDSSIKIISFNVYKDVNNVVMYCQAIGMEGIEFQFTLEDSNGVYITLNNANLTEDLLNKLGKLYRFYKQWRDRWFEYLNETNV
jgi:hypothetical protein